MLAENAGADVDISKVSELGDNLLTELDTLRREAAIKWSRASQCWLVTGHSQIIEAFSGTLPLTSQHYPGALDSIISPEDRAIRLPKSVRYTTPFITNQDKPDHTRLRKLYMKGFSRNVVEHLRPFAREQIEKLLDKADGGGVIEFNEEIARPLPGSVVLKLLGLPQTHLAQLQGWASATIIALGTNQPKLEWLDDYEDAVCEMEELFETELSKRRISPTLDLISELMHASEDGDHLTHDELIGALIQIIIAGHESTTGSISLALAALAKHPEHWQDLAEHQEKALPAAIELMRYSAMSAAMARVVHADFEWQGHQLKRGQVVMLMMAGGNRDPSVYPDPERLDFTRSNFETLTFGPGLHHCIGHLLAKMQVSEMLAAVTRRFSGAELLEDLDFMPQIVFRGLHKLNVKFLPRNR